MPVLVGTEHNFMISIQSYYHSVLLSSWHCSLISGTDVDIQASSQS